MIMSEAYQKELQTIQRVCHEIASSGKLTDDQETVLDEQFGERSKNALLLIGKQRVRRYRFKPSGRVVWAVRGRKGVYQVIPETNFCNCDDYYFRVMNGMRALCYHIIAQKIASALGKFQSSELRDRHYNKITQQWRTRPEAMP